MTPEQEQNLIKEVEELERKSIQVNLGLTESENLKNNLFETWIDTPPAGEKKTYLKMMWKNQPFYIPTGTFIDGYSQQANEAGQDMLLSYLKISYNGRTLYIPYAI